MLMICAGHRRKKLEAEFGSTKGKPSFSFHFLPLAAWERDKDRFSIVILLASLGSVRSYENFLYILLLNRQSNTYPPFTPMCEFSLRLSGE